MWIKPPTHSLSCVVCLFVFNEVNNINASIHPRHVSKDKILPLLPCASSSCGSCRIIIIMRTYFRGWLKVFNDADDSGGWPQFMIYRITDFRAQTQESRDLLASGGHWLEHYWGWATIEQTCVCHHRYNYQMFLLRPINFTFSRPTWTGRRASWARVSNRHENTQFSHLPAAVHAQFVKEGTH